MKIEESITKKLDQIAKTPCSMSMFLIKLPLVCFLVVILSVIHPKKTTKAVLSDF